MPTLEWIGKDKVVNHHQQVPYRVLEAQYTHNAERSDNMIIRGDNLEALKSLLPKYEGKIKCIYIDPPYNTGNEGWVYNDNVNDPKIKKWLGEVVGKEGEDLSRHDKWLCMMYPRLKLLHKLLSDDGAIFISIDDNEQANLRNLCDEVFGISNFAAQIIWEKVYSPRMDETGFSTSHDYVLCYVKGNLGVIKKELFEQKKGQFNYLDEDTGKTYRRRSVRKEGSQSLRSDRPNLFYPLIAPDGTELYPIKPDGVEGRWRWAPETYKENCKNGLVEWVKTTTGWQVYAKQYVETEAHRPPVTLWKCEEVGHNQSAAEELKAIFQGKVFDTPKPKELIQKIISIVCDKDSVVLDSFAGSGTTAHAVLNMNKADGGNRKFILIEMMDYADSITAERVKRVIDGYTQDQEIVLYDEEITVSNLAQGAELLEEAKTIAKEAKGKYSSVKKPTLDGNHLKVVAVNKAKDAVPGTGGDFTFYDLGEALLLPNGNLNENISINKIREYVYYMETKEALAKVGNGNLYFMGNSSGTAYYFYYEKEAITTLDYDFLATIPERADGYIIYADLCTIPAEELAKHSITFKKIPRDIAKL